MRSSTLVISGALSALLLFPAGAAATAPAGTTFGVTLNMKAYAKVRKATVNVKATNVPSGKKVKGFFLSMNENANPGPGAAGWKVGVTSYQLPDADGEHTVWAWAKHSGTPQVVTATPASDTIFLDRVKPTISSFTAPSGTVTSRTIAVGITANDPGSGATPQTGSGVARYAVVMGTTAPTAGAKAWKTTAPTSFKLSATNGSKTFSAFVRDAAGNVSLAETRTVTLELGAPTVSINLPNYTKVLKVPVSLSATDPSGSGIAGYLLKETNSTPGAGASGWNTKPTTFTLSSGQGSKTVYAWVKDKNGTVSAVASDSTTFDSVAPVAGLTITTASPATSRTINVIAAGNPGTGSPIVKYALINGTGTPTSSAWKDLAPTTHQLSLGNGTKTISLYVRDAAGNVSAADSESITMTLPAPTLTISLPAMSKSLEVTVSASPDDVGGTGLDGYFLSQTNSTPDPEATGWKVSPGKFTFTSGQGDRTLYAWVKDKNGSVSAVASDTTFIDTIKPLATLTVTDDETAAPILTVGGSDAGSGIDKWAIVLGTTAPIGSSSKWKETSAEATITLAEGENIVTVFTRDVAGNISEVNATSSKTVTVVP